MDHHSVLPLPHIKRPMGRAQQTHPRSPHYSGPRHGTVPFVRLPVNANVNASIRVNANTPHPGLDLAAATAASAAPVSATTKAALPMLSTTPVSGTEFININTPSLKEDPRLGSGGADPSRSAYAPREDTTERKRQLHALATGVLTNAITGPGVGAGRVLQATGTQPQSQPLPPTQLLSHSQLTPPLTPSSSFGSDAPGPDSDSSASDNETTSVADTSSLPPTPPSAKWTRALNTMARERTESTSGAQVFDLPAPVVDKGVDDLTVQCSRGFGLGLFPARAAEGMSEVESVVTPMPAVVQEEPTRFLEITNLTRTLRAKDIKEWMKPTAEVKVCIEHLAMYGFVFVLCYDIRDAIRAHDRLRSSDELAMLPPHFCTSSLETHYVGVERVLEFAGGRGAEFVRNTQGKITVKITDGALNAGVLKAALRTVGDIHKFGEPQIGQIFEVEYFNAHDVKKAVERFDGHLLQSLRLSVTVTATEPSTAPASPRPSSLTDYAGGVDADHTKDARPQPYFAPHTISQQPLPRQRQVAQTMHSVPAPALMHQMPPTPSGMPAYSFSPPLEESLRISQSWLPPLRNFVSPTPDPRHSHGMHMPYYASPYSHTYAPLSAGVYYPNGNVNGYSAVENMRYAPVPGQGYTSPPYYASMNPSSVPYPPMLPEQRAGPTSVYRPPMASMGAAAPSPEMARREEPRGVAPGNHLDLEALRNGRENRTTVMIKNIPNKMTDKELLEVIDSVVPRAIDFFYLRIDFKTNCNVGYAFVNFISTQDLYTFATKKLDVPWNIHASSKKLHMCYATYQGKEALVEKFRNSSIMDERDEWKPKVFATSGPQRGLPEPFPTPNHLRRKQLSTYNRGTLYVTGTGSGSRTSQSQSEDTLDLDPILRFATLDAPPPSASSEGSYRTPVRRGVV